MTAMNDTLDVTRPLPVDRSIARPFWDATREKKVLIQYDAEVGKYQFYPRPTSIFTGRTKHLEWREVSGKGKIFDLAAATARLATLESAHAADQPVLARAQQTWYELSSLQERFRSTEQLASERLRHLSAATDDERPGRDPDQLDAEAQRNRLIEWEQHLHET